MKIVLKLVLLLIFVSYYAQLVAFSHVHFDGTKYVIHSHPYSGGGHTHSGVELSTIGGLAQLIATVSTPLALLFLLFLIVDLYVGEQKKRSISFHYDSSPLRAPPALVY